MDNGSFPSARRSGRAPISRLSVEIISQILKELQDIDPQAVTTARLVCRAFNDLATPLTYATVHINQAIISPSAASRFPQALRNIHIHTRHIVLRSGLDRNLVSHLLNKVQKLRSVRYICLPLLSERPGLTMPDLRWSFICNTGPTYDRWVPSDIYSLTSHDPARIKIHIEGLPIGALDGKHADLYRSVIPSNLLVSLETSMQLTATSEPPRLPCLKELLLESRGLEVFRYRGSGKKTRFYFGEGERRLPAFKELTLRSYEWTHGVEETACHWDFSRIRSLELVSVSVFNFLSSVCLADFAGLHTLRVDDSGADQVQNHHNISSQCRAAAVSILVHHLVRDHIHSLTSLEIITQFEHFPIDALLRHSTTLKDLVFRDQGAFSDDYLPSPTLRLNDLRKLARNMDHLQSLELDMDVLHHKNSTRFLVQLCKFKSLRRLTLNVPTVVDSESAGTESWYTRSASADHTSSYNRQANANRTDSAPDADEKCANKMFEILRRHKSISGTVTSVHVVEWDRVTIKVGGWQSLMVRRVGNEVWRALNKRVVFAKRCFVMERVQAASRPPGTGTGDDVKRDAGKNGEYGVGGDGKYVVREQRYVEMRLGRGHPWPR
ncbi:hypothetical protein V8F20_004867 [Naviculisporaceae sp. PSN 640]